MGEDGAAQVAVALGDRSACVRGAVIAESPALATAHLPVLVCYRTVSQSL